MLGETSRVVADRLGISGRTAEKHRAAIMHELDSHNVGSLISKVKSPILHPLPEEEGSTAWLRYSRFWPPCLPGRIAVMAGPAYLILTSSLPSLSKWQMPPTKYPHSGDCSTLAPSLLKLMVSVQ